MDARSELTMQGNLLVDPEVATLEAGVEAVAIPEVGIMTVLKCLHVLYLRQSRCKK